MTDITVVLVKPRLSGNVGAIARVMKNFGYKKLQLIEPVCNHKSKTARKRAKWANEILTNAKISKLSSLKRFDYLVGTTGKLGSDYNINRTPTTPDELRELLAKKKGKVGIVFGPEDRGLLNDELALCDITVSIPAGNYPVLNLSQAVGIVLYELSKDNNKKTVAIASAKEKKIIEEQIDNIIKKLEFPTREKGETQKKVWKRIFGKSVITKREAFAAIGFFKRLINSIDKK